MQRLDRLLPLCELIIGQLCDLAGQYAELAQVNASAIVQSAVANDMLLPIRRRPVQKTPDLRPVLSNQ